jgi:hypothetical protein
MTTKTAREILNSAKRAEKTVRLCLRGDLVAEFEALEERLADLTVGVGWGNGDDATAEVAARLTEIRAEMLEDTVTFKFRALPRIAPRPGEVGWEELNAKHTGENGLLNIDAFLPELVAASLVDPAMTAGELDELYDLINDGQRTALGNAAWSANTEDVAVPFSERASVVMRAREPK